MAKPIIHIGKGSSSATECGAGNPTLGYTRWQESTCYQCLDAFGRRKQGEADRLAVVAQLARRRAETDGRWYQPAVADADTAS